MTKRSKADPKLQARVKVLKKRAQTMAQVKEAPFMRVLEGWLSQGNHEARKKPPLG